MFENINKFFKKIFKTESKESKSGKEAKERLHLVLMQDRANVSADFLDMMKQEIIEVIKKYIDVDENAIDVRLTNQANDDGTNGAPALYANIPIINIKESDESKNLKNDDIKLESKSTINKTSEEVKDEDEDEKEKEEIEEEKEEDSFTDNKNTVIINSENNAEETTSNSNDEISEDNSDKPKE